MSLKDKLIAVIGGSQPTAAETHFAEDNSIIYVGSPSEAVDKALSLISELTR